MSPEHAEAFHRRFEACDVKRRDVPPPSISAAFRELLPSLAPLAPRGPAWPPVLTADVNGPGWDGFEYDPSTARFFIPGALTPVIGDVLLLELRTPEPVTCRARVVAVRPLEHASPGRPSGFELALGPGADRVRSELAVRCALRREFRSGRRSNPRFRVTAPVRVTVNAGEPRTLTGTAGNLSLGGTFVTGDMRQAPPPVGTPVEVKLTIPEAPELAVTGTVVHVKQNGFGLRFEHDPLSQAHLANLLAQFPGRLRRVLVIDDDALARRVLADAFDQAGFDVLTAPDALSGLQTLTEEMLTLDLLVTDVVMREIDGVELLRRIRLDGNEADLPILAITASVTAELKERLLLAGADAVAVKSIGPRLIVQAAEDVLARRDVVRSVEDRAPLGNGMTASRRQPREAHPHSRKEQADA
jgi:CheY-like chemotaxis protein